MTSALGFKAKVDPSACVLRSLRALDSSDSPLVLIFNMYNLVRMAQRKLRIYVFECFSSKMC